MPRKSHAPAFRVSSAYMCWGRTGVYDRRYPASFQRFGCARNVNDLAIFTRGNDSEGMMDAYDNSVAYTDWFLES